MVGQEEAGPPAARVSWVAQTGGGRKLGGFCPGKVVKEGEVGGGDGLGGEGEEQRAVPPHHLNPQPPSQERGASLDGNKHSVGVPALNAPTLC